MGAFCFSSLTFGNSAWGRSAAAVQKIQSQMSSRWECEGHVSSARGQPANERHRKCPQTGQFHHFLFSQLLSACKNLQKKSQLKVELVECGVRNFIRNRTAEDVLVSDFTRRVIGMTLRLSIFAQMWPKINIVGREKRWRPKRSSRVGALQHSLQRALQTGPRQTKSLMEFPVS